MSEDTVLTSEVEVPQIAEVMLNILSNTPNQHSLSMLEMLYTGFYKNQVGLMDALNTETGQVDKLIVGLELDPLTGKVDSYPLARILAREEMNKYLAPDGVGGFREREAYDDELEDIGESESE